MTFNEIQQRLAEIKIEYKSHYQDEQYDVSELLEEKEELEQAIENGDYLDAPWEI
jgi:hypothetical protein